METDIHAGEILRYIRQRIFFCKWLRYLFHLSNIFSVEKNRFSSKEIPLTEKTTSLLIETVCF